MGSQERVRTIRQAVEHRGITCLCHFTPIANLDSILTYGLLPRSCHDRVLGEKASVVCYPDRERRDALPDATCLSLMFPNAALFYAKRCQGYFRGWCVLRLAPSILWELNCSFLPANAASSFGKSLDARQLNDIEAFELLFGDHDSPHALCEDYEVLVFDSIPVENILAMEFDEPSYNRWLAYRRVVPRPGVVCHVRDQYFKPNPVYKNGILVDRVV